MYVVVIWVWYYKLDKLCCGKWWV